MFNKNYFGIITKNVIVQIYVIAFQVSLNWWDVLAKIKQNEDNLRGETIGLIQMYVMD